MLADAQALLAPRGEGEVNQVIAGLENQRQRQQEAAEEAAALLARTELLHEELLQRWQQQKEQSAELQEQRRQQLERSIRDGQKEVRRIIRRLRQGRDVDTTSLGETARRAGQRLKKLEQQHRPQPERRDHNGWRPGVGDRVRVLSLGKAGEVLALSADGRELTVRCGVMRLNLELSAIEGLNGEKPAPPEATRCRCAAVTPSAAAARMCAPSATPWMCAACACMKPRRRWRSACAAPMAPSG